MKNVECLLVVKIKTNFGADWQELYFSPLHPIPFATVLNATFI